MGVVVVVMGEDWWVMWEDIIVEREKHWHWLLKTTCLFPMPPSLALGRRLPPRLFLSCGRRRHLSTAPAYEDCDVVIVGGGPAGLALAGALGQLSISVLILLSSSQTLQLLPMSFDKISASHLSRPATSTRFVPGSYLPTNIPTALALLQMLPTPS